MAKQSILLVEDETFLCWIFKEELAAYGYDVCVRTTGNEGMAALEADRSFDALVTNIRLVDGPDGWSLARRARELNPLIEVVYISGDSAAQHEDKGVRGSLMLSKPFHPEELHQALASLVDGKSRHDEFSPH
jgi:two-component system, cell cycle response regulator CpdR